VGSTRGSAQNCAAISTRRSLISMSW
jgi:hypothetical protein